MGFLQHSEAAELCERFCLRSGQMRSGIFYKNLHWTVNQAGARKPPRRIGFGDLNDLDVSVIQMTLEPGEVFFGWNEHHGTSFQQTDHPVLRIDVDSVSEPSKEALYGSFSR